MDLCFQMDSVPQDRENGMFWGGIGGDGSQEMMAEMVERTRFFVEMALSR